MSAESREAVKKSLSQLERRANYLHNPRHSAHVHINTASYGPVKMKKEDNNIQQERLFIAEPPEIIFTGYLPGETYQVFLSTSPSLLTHSCGLLYSFHHFRVFLN